MVNTFTPTKHTATKQITLPSFDVDKHEGKTAFIDIIEEGTVTTKAGKTIPVVKCSTQVIDVYNDKEVRVTKTFWLNTNEKTGEVGWTVNSDLAKFLTAKGVSHYSELQNKKVILIVEVNDKKQRMLSFR